MMVQFVESGKAEGPTITDSPITPTAIRRLVLGDLFHAPGIHSLGHHNHRQSLVITAA